MNDAERPGGKLTRRGFLGVALGAGIIGATGALAGCSSGSDAVQIINTSATGALAVNTLLANGNYFQKAGVQANIMNVNSGNQVLAAIASGTADLTMLSGLISVFPALDKGMKLRVLGGTEVVSTSAVFSGNPAVQSLHDLAGKTIASGTVGSELYDVFAALLRKYKISDSRVTFQNIGSSADSFNSVLAKRIDVGYGQVGDQPTAAANGVRMIATVSTELPLWINQGAVTSPAAIAAKRDKLVRVLAAFASLFQYLATPESKADYVKAYTDAGGSTQSAEVEWQFLNRNQAYSPTLALPADKVEFLQEQNVKNGSQSKVHALGSYTDFTLREEALALLKK